MSDILGTCGQNVLAKYLVWTDPVLIASVFTKDRVSSSEGSDKRGTTVLKHLATGIYITRLKAGITSQKSINYLIYIFIMDANQ